MVVVGAINSLWLFRDGHKPWRPQQRRPQTITVPK